MIKNIFMAALKNFQTFLVVWFVVIISNQLFIFGACFAPHCLMAAVPHTLIIALLVNYFFASDASKSAIESDSNHYVVPEVDIQEDDFEEEKSPFCPRCGSNMVLRSAKNGAHAGRKFWGCSKFPTCKGILNL